MIRRDTTLPDGSPGWILISQIEHARLSGELAAAWGGSQVAPFPFPETLIPTIHRHDDGWRLWEARPEIEPAHHRPYNFLEIPAAIAHGIWSASIDEAADLGPLAQATIAGHFTELRRRHPGHDSADAARFLATYEPRIRDWRNEWRKMSPDNTQLAADRALAALQFFDAWSLWLCCSAATAPAKLSAGNQFAVEVEPRQEGTIIARPWPFASPDLTLAAAGRLVPARTYRDVDDLAAVLPMTVALRWAFRPGAP